ncbi:TPA: DNA-3-methyladenine glycosylase I [Streptococcus suis]
MSRCAWVNPNNPLYIAYHDEEWGKPLHDEQAFLRIQEEFGTFDHYLWSWVNFTPIDNSVKSFRDLPTKNDLSERLSKDLKKRGFKFVGPVCVYSYLQAAGLLNEHEETCDFRNPLRTN